MEAAAVVAPSCLELGWTGTPAEPNRTRGLIC